WLTAADCRALDSAPAVARFTALNLPVVASVAASSAGLHIAILAADGAGTIPVGPRAALYGGVSVFLLASAALPAPKVTRAGRAGGRGGRGGGAGDRRRRDGAGLHGGGGRAGLPGASPHRRPGPGALGGTAATAPASARSRALQRRVSARWAGSASVTRGTGC